MLNGTDIIVHDKMPEEVFLNRYYELRHLAKRKNEEKTQRSCVCEQWVVLQSHYQNTSLHYDLGWSNYQ